MDKIYLKNHFLCFGLIFYLISGLQAVYTQSKVLLLQNHVNDYSLNGYLEHFCDDSQSKEIAEISSPAMEKLFQPYTHTHITENPEKHHWFRFTVSNQRDFDNQSWYFESFGFNMDAIDFYVPDQKGGYIKTGMGYSKPFELRNIFHKNPDFLIQLAPKEQQTYYLKVSNQSSIYLGFFIKNHEEFIRHVSYEYWYLGIFYGILGFIIMVSIFMAIVLRDRLYVFYLAYLMAEVLLCFSRDGLGFQFIWAEYPFLNHLVSHDIPHFLFLVCTILFSIHFLGLKNKNPLLYKYSIIVIILRTLLFIYIQFQSIPHTYLFVIDAVLLLLPVIAGIDALRKGNQFVKYYLIAFLCLYTSFILIMLEWFQLLPFLPFNWYWINIGMFAEAIFLAMAIVANIRMLRRQNEVAHKRIIQQLREKGAMKDSLNQELEQKVKKRTEEIRSMLETLESKNQELNVLNEQVEAMNKLLSKDNEQLKTDITVVSQSRIVLKDINFDEFRKGFPDDLSCLKYLSELKWSKGYYCKKCNFNKGTMDKEKMSIRCRNCKYNESPTAGTIFHKLKFPITKAFYMMYLISAKDRNIPLDELSEILDLRRETCWSFRKKILQAKEEKQHTRSYEEQGWASLVIS